MTLKMAVLAPMPTASVRAAINVKPGARRKRLEIRLSLAGSSVTNSPPPSMRHRAPYTETASPPFGGSAPFRRVVAIADLPLHAQAESEQCKYLGQRNGRVDGKP